LPFRCGLDHHQPPEDSSATVDDGNQMQAALNRDRRIVIAALSLVICASWIYILNGAGMSMSAFEMSSWSRALGQAEPGQMSCSPSGAMADGMAAMATPAVWTAGYAILLFFMWWIMMVAMMLPNAAE
jgi:predicted metal-binding membrane protein